MRFMILIKSNARSEAGEHPTEAEFTAMAAYNEELADAGVLVAGEGLQRSAQGARVSLSAAGTTVTDGPFAEAKELIGGFWMIRATSLQEALDWAKRCPAPATGETLLEVRKVLGPEDFGDDFTPELQEAEQQLRDRVAKSQ
ncbi:YciI family protein [Amycolatopsis sp. H20-H5]|uniref:YciI family protein n=1 Tax=Amycolatopsis sp. H20-H5 TaxID=3046309 RepID=UPI002DB8C59A|nr:YciI family protein [Amycolatopsis sp. H20-H5]MEC3981720.1 YciI family protein [Amycolatopsis sp. H20-H5]